MGWESCDEDRDAEWDEAAESVCEEELTLSRDENSEEDFDEFAKSPIYQDTLKLHTWINAWLDRDGSLKDHPRGHPPCHPFRRLRRQARRRPLVATTIPSSA